MWQSASKSHQHKETKHFAQAQQQVEVAEDNLHAAKTKLESLRRAKAEASAPPPSVGSAVSSSQGETIHNLAAALQTSAAEISSGSTSQAVSVDANTLMSLISALHSVIPPQPGQPVPVQTARSSAIRPSVSDAEDMVTDDPYGPYVAHSAGEVNIKGRRRLNSKASPSALRPHKKFMGDTSAPPPRRALVFFLFFSGGYAVGRWEIASPSDEYAGGSAARHDRKSTLHCTSLDVNSNSVHPSAYAHLKKKGLEGVKLLKEKGVLVSAVIIVELT